MDRHHALDLLTREAAELPLYLLRNLPGQLGIQLRRRYWKRRLRFMGAGVVIGRNVSISCPEYVSIGERTWIDDNVTLLAGPPGTRPLTSRLKGHDASREGYLDIGPRVHVAVDVVLQAHGGLTLGEGMGIASGAKIYTLSHHYKNPTNHADDKLYFFGPMVPPEDQSLLVGHVELGRGSAVGLNAVVLPGSHLDEFSWLASGSVLGGRTPKGAILKGDPAEVVKYRKGFEPGQASQEA